MVIKLVSLMLSLLFQEFTDIYSRVKRQRKVVKRDMYGMPIETDNEDAEEGDDDDNEDNEGNFDKCLLIWQAFFQGLCKSYT